MLLPHSCFSVCSCWKSWVALALLFFYSLLELKMWFWIRLTTKHLAKRELQSFFAVAFEKLDTESTEGIPLVKILVQAISVIWTERRGPQVQDTFSKKGRPYFLSRSCSSVIRCILWYIYIELVFGISINSATGITLNHISTSLNRNIALRC